MAGLLRKEYCDRCGYYVKLQGHDERCVVTDDANVKEMRLSAWVGDALHTADVRWHLIKLGVPSAELQAAFQVFASREAQALAYDTIDCDKVSPRTSSVSSRSEAFEASYFGKFREAYLREVLVDSLKIPVPDLVVLNRLHDEFDFFNSRVRSVSASFSTEDLSFAAFDGATDCVDFQSVVEDTVNCRVSCPNPSCPYTSRYDARMSALIEHVRAEHPVWIAGYGRGQVWLFEYVFRASCSVPHTHSV